MEQIHSKAVLHSHTNYSDGMVSPRELVEEAASLGVSVLSITDHDTMAGVPEAIEAGKEFGVEIVAGEEIQTSLPRGLHVVGLFLKKPIPHSKPLVWTVDQIRQQGGLAVVAHPMTRIWGLMPAPTAALQLPDLNRLSKICKFDAIEIRHTRLLERDRKFLDKFYDQNQERLGAKIGAADCHFGKKDMLSNITIFKGKSAGYLYNAIKNRTTKAVEWSRGDVGNVAKMVQMKKAIVDVGFRRYQAMVWRWASFNFASFEEQL